MAMIDPSLLEGAHRAIERWGWRQATLERIATEAGVSRMTLHRHGITREGLLGALSERLEDDYRAAHVAGAHGARPRARAPRAGAGGYCEAVEAHLELLAALAEADHDAIFHEEGPRGLTRRAFTEPSGACCRTAPPTARWPPRTPRRPRPCCSTSSAGPTATCAGPRLGRRARARRRAAHRAGRGGRAVTPGLDRRGLAVLAAGHACADTAQGAVPALLPSSSTSADLLQRRGGAHPRTSVGSSAIQPLFGLGSDRLALPWLLPLGVFLAGLGVALVGLSSSYAGPPRRWG